jgi:peptidoglycan hydrolase-like protein with peptidoglycan-binding domain
VRDGDVFIPEGTRGPFVEAMQYYLVCAGHQTVGLDGPEVTVDGAFGPITGDAVALFQAINGIIPTGEPSESTFALMARSCATARPVGFEAGATTTEVAGHATPDDPDVLTIAGAAKQLLTLVALEGDVTFSVTGADGSEVQSSTSPWEAELPTTQDYVVQVDAAGETSYRLSVGLRSSLLVATDFGPMVLQPNGLAVSSFGDEFENTMAVIELLLGSPLIDSDWVSDDAACDGTVRHVTWIVQAAAGSSDHPAVLVIDYTQQGATTSFAQYTFRSFDLDSLDAVVTQLTTSGSISLGDTFADFTAAHGSPDFFNSELGLATFGDGMIVGFEGGDSEDRRIYYLGAGDDGCEDA